MSVERNTQQGDGSQERDVHPLAAYCHIAFVYTPDNAGCKDNDVDNQSGIKREPQAVDKEQFEPSSYLHDTRYDTVQHCYNQYHRAEESQEASFQIGIRILFIVIYQYDGRDTKQVEQMHTDGKTCQIGNQHQPAVAVCLVCPVFPFQYQPEYQCGKQAGVCIHFSFYSTEPERIAPCVSQCTYQTGAHDGNHLSGCHFLVFGANQFLGQMRDAPEEEKNTGGTHQCTHDVHHHSHLRRVACKLAEQVGCQHKERSTRRVSYFQFISTCDKFGTVPKAGSRLNGHAVGKCCNGKGKPSHQIVDFVVLLFHVNYFVCLFVFNSRKDTK